MLRQTIKMLFLGKAALDMSREQIETHLTSFLAKVLGTEAHAEENLEALRERIKETIMETSSQVMHRSEILESQFHEKLRRQVADWSLEALGDTHEINELRAEIASLRAELVQLRSSPRVPAKL